MTGVKYKGEKHTGPGHQSPYPLSRLAPPSHPTELSWVVAEAHDALSVQAAGKLQLLAEQMKALQQQVRQILLAIRKSQELHRVGCAIRKISGHEYHLYHRQDRRSFPRWLLRTNGSTGITGHRSCMPAPTAWNVIKAGPWSLWFRNCRNHRAAFPFEAISSGSDL